MSNNPQSFKDGEKRSDFKSHDRNIHQKYVFSSIEKDTETTYQLNNLMELTNQALLNTEEIKDALKIGTSTQIASASTEVGFPRNASEILFILSQVKTGVTNIELIVNRMDESMQKAFLSPHTTWQERLNTILSGMGLAGINASFVAIMAQLGMLALLQAQIAKVLRRLQNRHGVELPPGLVDDPESIIELTNIVVHQPR